jgi:hypothetical protein
MRVRLKTPKLTPMLTVFRESEYVSPRGRAHAIERRDGVHSRDVRHGWLISEIHAVVSAPKSVN